MSTGAWNFARRFRNRKIAGTATTRIAGSATTRLDRFLLFATIVLLPLQDHIPAVAGFSIIWIVFAVIAVRLLVSQPHALFKTWSNPLFLSVYVLLIAASIVESIHPKSSYYEIARIGQMVAGAILVASLCRDRMALRSGIYGYLIAGIWLSLLLYLTSYGALSGITISDTAGLSYAEVTQMRTGLFKDNPLQANLNLMALIAAQGAVVALAMMMTSSTAKRRIIFSACALFCLIATFLPLSRSGVVIVAIASACVMFSCGFKHSKTILIACLIGACIPVLVPDVVWSRMRFSVGQGATQMKDGRAQLYTRLIQHFPEYAISGVGAGNFTESREIKERLTGGTGTHNGFLHVTVYWGLLGLLMLIAVVVQVLRTVPRKARNDELALCLVGISVTLLGLLMVIHNLYSKEFTLGLGLLVGSRVWIWPTGKVQRNSGRARSLRLLPARLLTKSTRSPKLRPAS
jgi:hypothetical protein